VDTTAKMTKTAKSRLEGLRAEIARRAGRRVTQREVLDHLIAIASEDPASQAAAFAIFSHVVLALPYLVAGPLAAIAMKLSLADIVFLRRAREEAVETAPA